MQTVLFFPCINGPNLSALIHIQIGYSVTKINQRYLPLSYQSHLVLLLNKRVEHLT